MISLVTAADRPRHAALLAAMHRDRKRVFVDLLGWAVPVVDGQYEIDQFDGPEADYLIVHEGTRHLGSLRLLPTCGPHLLGSLFPELCAARVPRGPAIQEISRLVLAPGIRAALRLAVRRALIVALVEQGLAAGTAHFSCVASAPWLSQVLAMGWRCRPLGPLRDIGGEQVGALLLDVAPETLMRFRAQWGHSAPLLAAADPALVRAA